MTVYAGLIRGIGPATHAKMGMAALRERCGEAGLASVSTHLATGNLVFTSDAGDAAVRQTLRQVLESFGIDNAVVLRTAAELAAIHAGSPFADAAAERPSQYVVCFLAAPPVESAWIDAYPGRERLRLAGLDLYIDFPGEIAQAKLSLGSVERRLGVTMTARNWNTVETLTLATARLTAS